jgi:hypothetical protein
MEPEAMKRFAAALLAAFALAAPASAADLDAKLTVIHGINGTDLGFDEALSVDVCVAGSKTPLAANVPFRTVSDPFSLPAGRYDVEIRLTDGKCGGVLAVASEVSLAVAENATAIAHLTEYGTPTLTKFVNDVRALAKGQTRLFARHAAAFGDVNVYLRQGRTALAIRNLENPDQEGSDLRAGQWHVAIYPASSWSKPAFHATLPLEAGIAYFAYAVGSPARGTFEVLLQSIDLN